MHIASQSSFAVRHSQHTYSHTHTRSHPCTLTQHWEPCVTFGHHSHTKYERIHKRSTKTWLYCVAVAAHSISFNSHRTKRSVPYIFIYMCVWHLDVDLVLVCRSVRVFIFCLERDALIKATTNRSTGMIVHIFTEHLFSVGILVGQNIQMQCYLIRQFSDI